MAGKQQQPTGNNKLLDTVLSQQDKIAELKQKIVGLEQELADEIKKRLVKCKLCDGSGKTKTQSGDFLLDGNCCPVPCSNCNGTGKRSAP